jgi:N-acylneuraminate cytidylyltransferase
LNTAATERDAPLERGNAVGIVPARGGSQRIPRKNIKPFHGVPLIVRSIRTMLDSGVFARIVVSTDDPEIADLAVSAGASVPFLRPAELADDMTGTGAVIRHAIAELDALDDARTTPPDPAQAICLMYATAVFVTPADLRSSLHTLLRSDVDYVFAAAAYSAPIERALERDADGYGRMLWPEHLLTRSQDLPQRFHDVGQFYWGRRASWAAGTPVMTARSAIFEIPAWRVQDVDTPEDWRRAELLFDVLAAAGQASADDAG